MAAAAGKKRTTSLSLFMEACGLEVEEELSSHFYSVLGRRSMDRNMAVYEQRRSLGEAEFAKFQTWETSERASRNSDV